MPGDMRSSRGGVGVDTREAMLRPCPDESILLAYTRNQKIENPLSTHLHIERCQSCRQKCDEYERLNATLDVLASVQSNLSYPEPLAYEVFDVIRGGKRQPGKKQSRKAPALSIRVASIPIALLLTIGTLIVVTAVAALALMHAGNGAPSGSTHQFGSGQRSATVVVPQRRPAPRSRPTTAPAPVVSPTPTADPTAVSTPYIKLCSTPDDLAHSRMRICGYNFAPGDQVALVVKMPGSSAPKQRPAVVVDAQGTFQDSFVITNCKVPLAIFARDLNSPVNTSVLQNIPFANCPVPTLPGSAS
jgi:hypothetical protein